MSGLGRRTFLRGAGGAGIALPWLEAMGPRQAAAAPGIAPSGFPKRFLVWYMPTGYVRSGWVPTSAGAETSFSLTGKSLEPLDPHKADMVVIDGLDNTVSDSPAANGDYHSRGMATMLSGVESIFVPVADEALGGHSRAAGGPTLDQEIVRRLAPTTRFPSLELAINRWYGDQPPNTGMFVTSYLGADKPIFAVNNPVTAFAKIFGMGAGAGPTVDTSALQRQLAQRRSVLDAVGKTYQGLLPQLGQADRSKLDFHLTMVRDLEKRLAVPAQPAAPGCMKPSQPGSNIVTDTREAGTAQMKNMVAALACDLTRVGTLQWGQTLSDNFEYPFLGITTNHHELTHHLENPAFKQDFTRINRWFNEQLAALVAELKSVREGDGTLFDNTLIMTVSCLGCPDDSDVNGAHWRNNIPYVLLGRAWASSVKTGRFLHITDKSGNRASNQNLYTTILNAFDIQAATFGNPAFCRGPLAGL